MEAAPDRLVLGLVPFDPLRARDPRARAFVRAWGERASIYLVERNVSTYDELEREMTMARVHVAWLPPMLYARLERDQVAVPIVTRARARGYWSALVAKRGSRVQSLADLAHTRVAWVDPLSAAGYLLPRMGLMAAGIDPRATFAQEQFAGSHAEALRAALEGRVDVAATFAHLDAEGNVAQGSWTEIGVPLEQLQIVAILGEVPPDVVAARTSVPDAVRDALATALLDMAADPDLGVAVESVFGGRAFARGASTSYEPLRQLLDRASTSGVADASSAFLSTTPPTSRMKREE